MGAAAELMVSTHGTRDRRGDQTRREHVTHARELFRSVRAASVVVTR